LRRHPRRDSSNEPPVWEGDVIYHIGPTSGELKRFCVNRHWEMTNGAFLDFSVRGVGLKELWELPWHQNWAMDAPGASLAGVDDKHERLCLKRVEAVHAALSLLPAKHLYRGMLIVGLGVYQCGQEDVSQPVDAEVVEIIIREIQPESASEVPDSSFELVPSQRSDGGRGLLEIPS
jgi:hypothetical protein